MKGAIDTSALIAFIASRLYKADSSSKGLLYVSDGYSGRRHRREQHSRDYYDKSEPEELTRVFVALFDYDPVSMSPNLDAAVEELPFKEGQIIKVGASVIFRNAEFFLPWFQKY